MINPIHRLDSTTKIIVILGLLLTSICAALYLTNPSFVKVLNYKVTDAILASLWPKNHSDAVVTVTIDEKSLANYGQWPWPRYRLADLLQKIQRLGAKSIGLDMILAEPDRTSLKNLQNTIRREFGYHVDITDIPKEMLDNDSILADILSKGPFVLGFEFLFQEPIEDYASCRLHPLNIIRVHKQSSSDSGGDGFFEAKSVVCNLGQFSEAVTFSGFLNGTPDSDGILRRIPLLIKYENQLYPNLALATLLQGTDNRQIRIVQEESGQSYFWVGKKALPLDQHGNLLINFTIDAKNIPRVSAADIINDQVPEDQLKNKIVFIGISASGLTPIFQTPVNPIYSQAEVHAQLAETILTGQFIKRNTTILYYEVAVGIMLALFFCLSVARFGFVPNAVAGSLCIAGVLYGSRFFLQSKGILFSPLLSVWLVLINFVVLTVYKYWKNQLSARKNLNDALILMKASENKLNSIVNTIPDIVFRLDTSGKITFISSAISKYKRQPEELIGKPILDFVESEDRQIAVYRINERRTGNRATSNLELRLCLLPPAATTNHQGRYFSVSAEGIYGNEKPDTRSFLGTQGIARDINKRKQLEYQLEKSQKVEAVGNLAAGVAHDLNNILSGLVSYPELLLLELPKDSPMRKGLETIQQSGQKAAAIVQDLLTLARRGISIDEVVNLNAIISEYLPSAEFIKIQRNHPQVRLETDLFAELLNIKGSSIHLSKMLMNLISNAAEAMPAGGRIVLKTRNRYLDTPQNAYEVIPEGEYVVLSVIDEGVGIAQKDLSRIFEPFYTKKRMGQSGTGLGMTVIWSTVKDLAGFIDVESHEGEGTRFDIYLPATRETMTEREPRIVLQDYVGTEHILVVDDIPEQREIAVKMLGKLGYVVESVSSGEAAVEYVQSQKVDLIVLDMVMLPGMDGLETYQQIKSLHPDQKAIIASGFSESKRVKTLQKLGAGAYIRKPYTLEKIGLAVRSELNRQ
jgi:PAS domain S-box-containing protein